MYKLKELKLKNIFSFWNHFQNSETFLFYNPIENQIIIGAEKLKSFEPDEDFSGYKYIFSTKPFFEKVKEGFWRGYGAENIAFCYYLSVKEGKQTLYYKNKEPKIEDIKPLNEHYSYVIENENYEKWIELFNQCHKKILSKELKKVVISRVATAKLSKKANQECILKRLIDDNLNNFVFAYKKKDKCFLGATPEILLRKDGHRIESHALAGTYIKDNHGSEKGYKTLLDDQKNFQEHQLVISSIENIFKAFGENTHVSPTKIMETRNLYHLESKIYTESNESIFRWRDRLHPTPALGGSPKEVALRLIQDNEFHERGLYASPIGLINDDGNGLFVVGIRSAILSGHHLHCFAGCGIVESSDCEEEYIETKGKLRTILECL